MTTRLLDNAPPWPNGARCAVCFTYDLDAESLLHIYHRESTPKRITASSTLRYGPQTAIPRLIRLFEHHDIRQTFFVPGWCVEAYPDAVKALADAGHEIAHHSWLHERPNQLTPADERAMMEHASAACEKVLGKRPVGYRAPSGALSPDTHAILAESGFLYSSSLHSDDVPFLVETKAGTVLELPTDPALDDWPQYVNMKEFGFAMPTKAPSHAFDLFREEFDAAWANGGMWITIWHPFVSGRLGRAEATGQLIEHMKGKGDVWFATLEEIATHLQGLIAAGTWTPRRETLPYWTEPVDHLVPMHPL